MMRVVLDTNVWLDWLVFHDRGVAPLKAAHAAGAMEIVRSVAGEQELERVLAYDALKRLVDAASGPAFMAQMRTASTLHDGSTRPGALPVCSDPDDQPFLELARDSGAALLVSKDRDLLELRRAKYHITTGSAGFRITTPAECAALLRTAAPA